MAGVMSMRSEGAQLRASALFPPKCVIGVSYKNDGVPRAIVKDQVEEQKHS